MIRHKGITYITIVPLTCQGLTVSLLYRGIWPPIHTTHRDSIDRQYIEYVL